MKTKITFVLCFIATTILILILSEMPTIETAINSTLYVGILWWTFYVSKTNRKVKLNIELLTDALKQSEVDIIQLNREISGYKEQITALTRKRDSSGKYVGKVKSVKKLEPFKIRVTPEESRVVQEVLFENGYEWGLNGRNVVNTEQPFLLIDMDDDLICYMKDGCDNQFCNLREPEITFSQFKSIYKIK